MARQRIGSILVATDLGEGSEVVVAAAGSLAERAGAELHTLHSLQLPGIPSDDVMRRTGFFGQIEAAEKRLHEQGRRVARVTPASEVVILYVASRAILERAVEVSADLIVLGSHRGIGLQSHFIGTTTDRVVRSAQVSCLIIGDTARFPVPRLGVATDFSPSAREALDLAISWAEDLAGSPADQPDGCAEVRLVHVAHPLVLAGDPDLTEAIHRAMSQLIHAVLAARQLATASNVRPAVLWHDNPGEALSQWVGREQIGLLVMGTHGAGVMKRALIGSAASSLARLTPCPVLLVPPSPSIAMSEG